MHLMKAACLMCVLSAATPAQDTSPLNAMLTLGVGEPAFHLNQPAYVAVFEFLPGRGVRQVLPVTRAQAAERMEPGQHLLSRYYTGGMSQGVTAIPIQVTKANGQTQTMFYASRKSREQDVAPTRTLVIVASRHPLRRVASREEDAWLRQVTNFRSGENTVFASEAMVDAVVGAVMPAGFGEDDQSADVLEFDTRTVGNTNHLAGQALLLACPSGSVSISAQEFSEIGSFRCPGWPVTPKSMLPRSAFGESAGAAVGTSVHSPVLAGQKSGEPSVAAPASLSKKP